MDVNLSGSKMILIFLNAYSALGVIQIFFSIIPYATTIAIKSIDVLDYQISVGLSVRPIRSDKWRLTDTKILFFYYISLHNSIFDRMGFTYKLTQMQIVQDTHAVDNHTQYTVCWLIII